MTVLYGSATGSVRLRRPDVGAEHLRYRWTSEPRDLFGTAVTTGDFDGDRFDDLAVGVPAEDIDGDTDAGAVNVIYGSSQA